jgi:hypothetical protein
MADWITANENSTSVRAKLNALKTLVDSKIENVLVNNLSTIVAGKANLVSGKAAYNELPNDVRLSSYNAFINNFSTASTDLAFGKYNESNLKYLGYQMALYTKNIKSDATVYTEIPKYHNLTDILANNPSYLEVYYSTNMKDLLNLSPWAIGKYNTPISDAQFSTIVSTMIGASTSYTSFATLVANPTDFQKLCRSSQAMNFMHSFTTNPNVLPIKKIRETTTAKNFINGTRVVLSTVGAGTYTVPANVKTIHAVVVGGGGTGGTGGDGSAYYACGGGSPGAGGQYIWATMDVTGGQTISYSVGAAATNSVFGSITAAHSYHSSQLSQDYVFPQLAGNGYDGGSTTNYGTYGAGGGGGGGYGGGGGGGGGRSRSTASTQGGGGGGGIGGIGGGAGASAGANGSDSSIGGAVGVASNEYGGGGGGYGGATARTGGAGGQGIIVLYLTY